MAIAGDAAVDVKVPAATDDAAVLPEDLRQMTGPATPVSSSMVMHIMPFGAPHLAHQNNTNRSRPAAVTRLAGFTAGDDPFPAKVLRRNAIRCCLRVRPPSPQFCTPSPRAVIGLSGPAGSDASGSRRDLQDRAKVRRRLGRAALKTPCRERHSGAGRRATK
jgi:hypothetical protein